ncbi:hypothetical protein FOCC_FOCC012944 [Frankliniella occidentalis]|nr:hypothetical protein FOCC_FOCC012944 [Frankliniella occidentalis]
MFANFPEHVSKSSLTTLHSSASATQMNGGGRVSLSAFGGAAKVRILKSKGRPTDSNRPKKEDGTRVYDNRRGEDGPHDNME